MPKDPRQEAEDIHDERANAATTEDERAKIKKQPVEPLLNEPGTSPREWD